ncbi:MAG TPA: NAD(P)/FAD-dependent oxidoreductase [Polyangiaceae bacterium]|nr:NAD(P)/FAD-dependent oxidoreductase [Polyangiaceae bacterium]
MEVPDVLDTVVIGGGVIGLSVARALALAGREVFVLEAEAKLGMHTSSRNSEVVHAGIYYEPGSLKATLCRAGRQLLYAYCERYGVPFARPGKLILATRDEEVQRLEEIYSRAQANGVDDLAWLTSTDVSAREPNIVAVRALFSPSTGIVDSHALMAAFKRDAVANGAHVITSAAVLRGHATDSGFVLELGGRNAGTVRCRALVNAAGLRAPSVSRSLTGIPNSAIPGEHYAKGHYFVLDGAAPFRHLIYPVPVSGGLGIHVTLDLAGRVRFGPDVTWIEGIDYSFDTRRVTSFYDAIRPYYPALADGSLSPGYTGIRPKVARGDTPHDFVIRGPRDSGVSGFCALYGIESPGLTAALAIADHVRDELT